MVRAGRILEEEVSAARSANSIAEDDRGITERQIVIKPDVVELTESSISMACQSKGASHSSRLMS